MHVNTTNSKSLAREALNIDGKKGAARSGYQDSGKAHLIRAKIARRDFN
jgi:hypothetical protein